MRQPGLRDFALACEGSDIEAVADKRFSDTGFPAASGPKRDRGG